MLPYIIWITKRGIKGLNIGARFRDCKPGHKGLQIGEFQLYNYKSGQERL